MDPKISLKKADNALKTTIFKWSKNYDKALHYYQEAVDVFKFQKDYLMAIESNKKLVKVYIKLNDNFGICKTYISILNCIFLNEGTNVSKESLILLIDESINYFFIEKSMNTLFSTINQICK